ncbi:TMEM175 family protein [Maridesulfovibrio frigidus]|uniref:TMEM175 family protein n=1 Tax=Maridesulfovibrio frigidus TaxID=340956 RepID=UPI0004E1AF0C|nr:TMEM175 family protein [Maridesulfovibrio frigidus]
MNQEEYREKRHARQLPRLKVFMDVVFAILLWQIFMMLPDIKNYPEVKTVWELLTIDLDDLATFVIGLIFIVIYWGQNNRLFSHLVSTDNKHTAISVVQLFLLLTYFHFMSMGLRFNDDPSALLMQSVSLALVGFTSMWGWHYAANKKDLIDSDMPKNNIPYMKVTILPEPIAACISIPFAFVGPIAWEISWLSYPIVAYLIKKYVNAQVAKAMDSTP